MTKRNIFNITALVITSIAIFYICTFKILDRDFWWHIKAGEIMWNTKSLIHTDIFSYTNAVRPGASISVYKEPLPDSEVIDTLLPGTRLRALTYNEDWISLLLPSGTQGWVERSTVTLEKHTGPSASAQHN